MEIEGKTRKLILGIVAFLYVAMFAVAVFCAYYVYCIEHDMHLKNSICNSNNVCTERQSRKMKSFDKCLTVLAPATDADGKCEWLDLKDGTQVGKIENYYVQDTKIIPPEILQDVLNENFYLEKDDVANYGIYMPVVRISYMSASGEKISLIYSFSNAQVNLYLDNKLVKEALLNHPDEFTGILESL